MDMLSRVGDSLYWMSRYLERAEHTSRVLEVHIEELLEEYGGEPDRRWRSLIEGLGLNLPAKVSESELGHWLSLDATNRSSIVSFIMFARDNTRQVREQISSEMWEQLNRLFHRVRSASLAKELGADQQSFLHEVKEGAHLFQGITDSTMNHGEGWHFIQLGRFLERAVSVASTIDVHFRDYLPPGVSWLNVEDHPEGVSLLKSVTAFEAYCKVYTAELKPMHIAEFLILNPEFPHSVRFAVDQVELALQALPQQSGDRPIAGKALRLAGKLKALLSFSEMDEIMATGLHVFLEDIERQCSQIHNAVHQIYIEYPIESALES